ncbi:MAG: helix-turn-helix domain-containing protein [Clostridia bacterium]|nr:helix-turn-helix domain-containing protein [Clostridia bacterium]
MLNNNLGNKIRSLRKSVNITQAELGKILGYSARTVSDWENGCTEPKIDAIKAMVKFFDISYTEFFEDI